MMTGENQTDLRTLVHDLAIENYKNGLNCAESVLYAFIRAGLVKLPPKAVGQVTGFGGGLGLTGHTCGALSAAVLAIGAVHGRAAPWDSPSETRGQETQKYYRRYNRLTHDFAAAHGGVLCRDITAPFPDWSGRDRRKACLKLIGATAALAYDYLTIPQEEAFALDFGPNMAGH